VERDRLGAGLRVRGRAGQHLKLAVVTPELRDAARRLAPLPEQQKFAGTGEANMASAALDPTRTCCLGIANGEPVVFFMLQPNMPELRRYLPGADVIGMRGFFVDHRHQRKGHGTAALRAMPAFTRELYSDARAIGLTVNVVNGPAVKTYLRAGFRDTGELYHGGRLGPQHVLVIDL
jgi:GNAT superfamily N-acetyltransferase